MEKTSPGSHLEAALPPGWSAHQSKSNPGHFYYFNCRTGATTWNRSEIAAAAVPVDAPGCKATDVSGNVPSLTVSKDVNDEHLKNAENHASAAKDEDALKIAHLEELLRLKKEEMEGKNAVTTISSVVSRRGGVGLGSGLRSRKKGALGAGEKVEKRGEEHDKASEQELQPAKDQHAMEVGKAKQRIKITFMDETQGEPEIQVQQRWKETEEEKLSLKEEGSGSKIKHDEAGSGDYEEGFSSGEELYGMDEEEAAKLKSLKNKFVEEEPECSNISDDGGGGICGESDQEESNLDSSPERLGARKRKSVEQLRLIEEMEQTLREKYGYTDETYGQRYIKKDVEEKKRFAITPCSSAVFKFRSTGIAGRACETWWLRGEKKDGTIYGRDHLLKNSHMRG